MIDPSKPKYENTPLSANRVKFRCRPPETAKPPLISIVTPVWNSGAFLAETKYCVLQQTLQRFEWIIVDDGSDDTLTLTRIRQYEREDPRVRVICLGENLGPSAARNAGLKELRSELVLFLDSDNLIEPTTAEKMYWFLLCFPQYAFVTGFCVGFGDMQYLWERGFHSREAFLRNNQVDLTSLVRRDVLLAVNGFDETIRAGGEDWDLWLRCADRGFWGATIPEFLIWYRRRADHSDRWPDWDQGPRQAAFRAEMQRRYPSLWTDGFPRLERQRNSGLPKQDRDSFPSNVLATSGTGCLILLPKLDNTRYAKRICEFIGSINKLELKVTIVIERLARGEALAWLTKRTPDVFVLSHFLSAELCFDFMGYLMRSRGIGVVINLGRSALGNSLRKLNETRAQAPNPRILNLGPLPTSRRRDGQILERIREGMRTGHLDHPPNVRDPYEGVAPIRWTPEYLCSPASTRRRILAFASRFLKDKFGISIGTWRFV